MKGRKIPALTRRFLTLPVLAIALTLPLQGCLSSFVAKPISETNKDTTGAFDGQWTGVVKSTAGQQQGTGNWRLTCNDRAGDKFGPIVVNGGQATMPLLNKQNTTFVNSKGQFRFEVPTETSVSESDRSDTSLNNGAVTLILNGSLTEQTGHFIIGIAEFANSGCTSKVVYEKA